MFVEFTFVWKESETVREADSLSSAQSGHLIRSASNGGSQYPGGEEPPGICRLHQPVSQHAPSWEKQDKQGGHTEMKQAERLWNIYPYTFFFC